MSRVRGYLRLAGFFALTLPLMPVQAVLVRLTDSGARRFPHWYHKQVCRVLGVRLKIDGSVQRDRPVLLISNHTSWLDIPVLSAVAPVSFVAKKEVSRWPFVSSLARLQRTVFVDRTRRSATGQATSEINRRLGTGDVIVLFPEGTSSDGNRVLPFKTALFGALDFSKTEEGVAPAVQTIAVVYTGIAGIPVWRADRPKIGWYGDMEMLGHAWNVLKGGTIDATIRVGEPVPLTAFADRKALAKSTEAAIRRQVIGVLRGRVDDPNLAPVEPGEAARRVHARPVSARAEKWT